MLWTLITALAADVSAGSAMPGAGDVEPGFVEMGAVAGGFLAVTSVGGLGAAAGLRAAWWPLPRVVLSAGGGSYLPYYPGEVDPAVAGGGSVRFLVVNRTKLRLGAAVGVGALGGPLWETAVGATANVVIEIGERVRFDGSLPLIALDLLALDDVHFLTNGFLAPLVMAEAGVGFPIGDRNRLRLGKDVCGLGIAWRHQHRGMAVEVRLASMGVLTGLTVNVDWQRPRTAP